MTETLHDSGFDGRRSLARAGGKESDGLLHGGMDRNVFECGELGVREDVKVTVGKKEAIVHGARIHPIGELSRRFDQQEIAVYVFHVNLDNTQAHNEYDKIGVLLRQSVKHVCDDPLILHTVSHIRICAQIEPLFVR